MRHLSLAASALAVGTAVLYLGVLLQQGTPIPPLTISVVTAALIALAVLAAYGSLSADPARRAVALWAAVPGFFGLGYISGFSIGGLLLVGGILTLPVAIAASRGTDLRRPAAVGWALLILLGWAAIIALLFIAAAWRGTG